MNRYKAIGWIMLAIIVSFEGGVLGAPSLALAADAPAPAAAPPEEAPPMVKPAAPGVFSSRKLNATRFNLVVTGHTMTSREDIEKYLAYRAAQLTTQQGDQWFSFNERRSKGDKLPVPKPDPQGVRYSFRMEFFRPVWRYKTAASPAWKTWSPFSGASFWADGVDPKTVTAYDVSADIVLHKGQVDGDNPLAFDAGALSDYLINQVEPPQ